MPSLPVPGIPIHQILSEGKRGSATCAKQSWQGHNLPPEPLEGYFSLESRDNCQQVCSVRYPGSILEPYTVTPLGNLG